MTTPAELAAQPATEGHIERAKEAVRAYPAKQKYLEALLASNPTRGQMVEFTESVRVEAAAAQLNQRINVVRKVENFDATLAASQLAGKPIQPAPDAYEQRRRNEQRIVQLRDKWAI